MTETVFPVTENHKALLGGFLGEHGAHFTVHGLADVVDVLEDERQVENAENRNEGGNDGVGGQNHVGLAKLSLRDELFLFAQLVGGKDLDFNLTVGAFGHVVGKHLSTNLIVMVRCACVPQFECGYRLAYAWKKQKTKNGNGRG